ncbi:MAG: pilus assembly protein N-terminal domain-containing protein, partial [Pseudomonadota bacterium]|nr:pilus assembly protein N-terminal domain-containing protein [Pseudomonadota bacterium]
ARSPHMTARVAQLPPGTQRPTSEIKLSVGQGELITLPGTVSDVWVSNPTAADVYVSNPRQIHLFGKEFGEATVFATNAAGAVVYSTNVRVSQNLTSIDAMLKAAMPEADIHVTTVGQIAVINGTVASPDDAAQAGRLVTSLLNPGVDLSSPSAALKIAVVNRLKTAVPLQVNLQVRFAEVSKSFMKNIGANLSTIDGTGGFKFGVANGRTIATTVNTNPGLPLGVGSGAVSGYAVDPTTGLIAQMAGTAVQQLAGATTIAGMGKLFGLNILGALDAGETDGQVTTLANPNLSAISGETATFLAGGEIPIPIAQGGTNGAISVEYKQYGVSLAFTPTVLADGRISLRVRPEVSQLTSDGAVQISGTIIPALSTRRVETTLEMGSGQSMMIAGLLQNSNNNQITKTPGAGDLPILGALFRSNAFKRNETELVVVITPYLVKPVNANEIVLPTDGYKAPTDLGRVFMGQLGGGQSGEDRPKPTMAVPNNAPAFGATAPVLPMAPAPAPQQPSRQTDAPVAIPPQPASKKGAASATPGFSF